MILMTVFGNGLCALLFGLTVNLPMALVTRFLAGLANGGCFVFIQCKCHKCRFTNLLGNVTLKISLSRIIIFLVNSVGN